MSRETFARGAAGDIALALHVRDVHSKHGAYGSRRVMAELAALGIHASRKRVLRLMRERGMVGACEARKAPCPVEYAPQIVTRGFVPTNANEVWAGDTTQVMTSEGWLYLTIWIDTRSRVLVGWALGTVNDAALAIRALECAIEWRRPAKGLIVHSDRGSQFSSAPFRAKLAEHGFIQSMSRAATCHDNAPIESFFAGMKRETKVRKMKSEKRDTVRSVIVAYLARYNTDRRHSAREGSPLAFEALARDVQEAIIARAAARAKQAHDKRLARHAARREREREQNAAARAATVVALAGAGEAGNASAGALRAPLARAA